MEEDLGDWWTGGNRTEPGRVFVALLSSFPRNWRVWSGFSFFTCFRWLWLRLNLGATRCLGARLFVYTHPQTEPLGMDMDARYQNANAWVLWEKI